MIVEFAVYHNVICRRLMFDFSTGEKLMKQT